MFVRDLPVGHWRLCIFALFVLAGTGCLSTVVAGVSNGGAGTTNASGGGRTGTGNGGQTAGNDTGQSAGNATGQAAGSTTGVPQPVTCAPGAHYVGDVCLLDACGPTSPRSPCLLGDGGIGICAAGTCLSTQNDPSNCGEPGFACPVNAQCFDSQCWGSTPGIGSGCGQCPEGTICDAQSVCVVAICGPSDDGRACDGWPQGPGFCCHGKCLFENDAQNCGGCGTTCPADMVCFGDYGCVGAVTCGSDPLFNLCEVDGGPGTCCGASCIDWNWDPANCGGCGVSCPDGLECDAGLCLGSSCDAGGCPSGSSCIEEALGGGLGAASVCVPRCSPTGDGQSCNGGSCCGGQCVSLLDRDSCGGCGIACAPDEICISIESEIFPHGQCVSAPSCTPGGPPCLIDGWPGGCCGTSCVDLYSDSHNCMYCGFGCPAGTSCYGSLCVSDAGTRVLGCDKSTPCPQGEICSGGRCINLPGSCDGTTDFCVLPGGEPGTCCGDKCTDTEGDSNNCGVCGAICPIGSVCGSQDHGSCSLPSSGVARCPDVACPAGTICTFQGQCVRPGDCSSAAPGSSPCWLGPNKPASCCDGECADINQDPNNCGGCGISCASGICADQASVNYLIGPHLEAGGPGCLPLGPSNDCLASCGPDTFCLMGNCTPVTPLGALCFAIDGTVGISCPNGVCAHPRDDPQNCGICGNACPPGVACVAGACVGGSCRNGLWGGSCGDNDERTCCPGADCTDTQSDPLNCGYCGEVCPPGSSCKSGSCR